MKSRFYTKCNTMIGLIYIVCQNQKIVAIYLGEEDYMEAEEVENTVYAPGDLLLMEAESQITEYFQRNRKEFQLPLAQQGTDFQKSVWRELLKIPYGETRSYQDIAEAIGNPLAVRAIGQANKANNLAIIVPCHRVIGKNKKLTGYAGSRIDIKEKLLEIEGFHI